VRHSGGLLEPPGNFLGPSQASQGSQSSPEPSGASWSLLGPLASVWGQERDHKASMRFYKELKGSMRISVRFYKEL